MQIIFFFLTFSVFTNFLSLWFFKNIFPVLFLTPSSMESLNLVFQCCVRENIFVCERHILFLFMQWSEESRVCTGRRFGVGECQGSEYGSDDTGEVKGIMQKSINKKEKKRWVRKWANLRVCINVSISFVCVCACAIESYDGNGIIYRNYKKGTCYLLGPNAPPPQIVWPVLLPKPSTWSALWPSLSYQHLLFSTFIYIRYKLN